MARKTEACVLVLHHVSEQSEYGSPSQPPARRAIHGKVSQLPSIYGHLKCSTFEVVQYNEENDVYVDEEGLMYMNDDTKFFKLGNYPQPLAGNGLIMGFDDETGDNGDTKLSIEEIKNQVKFMSAFDVALSTRFGR